MVGLTSAVPAPRWGPECGAEAGRFGGEAGPDAEWFVPGEEDSPDDSGDDVVLDLSTPEADGDGWDEEADDFDDADEADEAVVPPKAFGVGTRE